MTARKGSRQPVPVFVDDCPEWREHVDKEADLLDRQRVAQERESDAEQQHRDALAAYDRALSAAAKGEADPPGPRPTFDPVPQTVAFRARERVRAHRAKRAALLAMLADRVESAAADWWESERGAVTEHVRALTDDAERLTDVLRQVREVRAALDRRDAGAAVRPAATLADRTAQSVDVATLADLGDSDPFALAPVVLPRGRVQRVTTPRERLGVRRYEHDGPSIREPGPPAVPTTGTNPGSDRL